MLRLPLGTVSFFNKTAVMTRPYISTVFNTKTYDLMCFSSLRTNREWQSSGRQKSSILFCIILNRAALNILNSIKPANQNLFSSVCLQYTDIHSLANYLCVNQQLEPHYITFWARKPSEVSLVDVWQAVLLWKCQHLIQKMFCYSSKTTDNDKKSSS